MQILENEDQKEKKKKGSCMNSLGQFLISFTMVVYIH